MCWTSFDLQGGKVRQISKIEPAASASNKHQSSHPGDSGELEEVGVSLLRNRALDKLHSLQVAKVESCQVLCQVGRGGSRVASDLDLAPSVTLLGLLNVDLQLHRADWRRQLGGTSQPVLRPVVRRSVAVAVASPPLASLVHLAEGIAHHQPHIKHHKEESSKIIGCLDNRHHLLPFIAWPGLHSMGPPMGPQCFEFSLFSSIEVLICRPIFHWSPLSWQQAPEIGFLHSFSSNCATC